MAHRRILVIEDDAAIRRGVIDALQIAGYETLEAANGEDGCAAALERDYDLLLLDLVLPGLDGLEILRRVRKARATMPVIILTARGAETDRIVGFRRGADDYVIKPFSMRELLARVDAVLRRSPERRHEINEIRLPDGVVDLERCEIRFDDNTRGVLSEREQALLRYLATNSDRAISRDEILSRVWHVAPHGVETRTIDMHIARLREKLREEAARPRAIITVHGKGYKLGDTVEAR